MSKNFLEAVKHRRSYYSITNESPVSDTEIENIISTVVKYGPSAFNSQSARVVLLLGDKHRRFWEIVKDVLKAQIGEERFPATGRRSTVCLRVAMALCSSMRTGQSWKDFRNSIRLMPPICQFTRIHRAACISLPSGLPLRKPALAHRSSIIIPSLTRQWPKSLIFRTVGISMLKCLSASRRVKRVRKPSNRLKRG